MGTASCHFGHTGTHLMTEVKQRWARLVLGWVTTQMKSMLGAVRSCTRYSGLTELLPISYTYSNTIRMDFGQVVLVWKYIVN
jgi:hypothetical protein